MYTIRPAEPADKAALVAFTQNTFHWGDYIESRFDGWLADPNSMNLVAVSDGVAVGLSRGAMLSPTELWLQGGRVHPDHRGHGLSAQMSAEIKDWARSVGGRVARCYIEDSNEVSRHIVELDAFRRVSRWLFAFRDIVDRDPQPTGNGGKRVPGPERLREARSGEADPAFMAWSTSELARAARGTFPISWTWRSLTVDDLTEAARQEQLLEASSGWVLAEQTEDALDVSWIATNPGNSYRMVRAVLDRAVELGAPGLRVWFPVQEDLQTALTRIGCDFEPGSVWERSLLEE